MTKKIVIGYARTSGPSHGHTSLVLAIMQDAITQGHLTKSYA